MTLNRRDFLKRLATGAAAVAAPAMFARQAHAAPDPRPNIVYIMGDDHSRFFTNEYLSRFGIPEIANLMPNLARLRDGGMRFANAFCSNSICGPARATLLSGKYSHIHGLTGGQTFSWNMSQEVLPTLLHNAGYQTAVFGKWHLGLSNTSSTKPQGFDRWKLVSDNPGTNLEEYFSTPYMLEESHPGTNQTWSGYITTNIANDGLAWVSSRNPDKPFCLFLWHRAPHEAWKPESKYASLFNSITIPEPSNFNDNETTRSKALYDTESTFLGTLLNLKWDRFVTVHGKQPIPSGLTDPQKKSWLYQQVAKDYMRTLKSLDDSIGTVLNYLDANGLANNTIVVYTSDNGFFVGEHGLYDKRFIYEGGMAVPLYIRYPQMVAPGSVCTKMVCDVDYAPTLLDLAGISIPGDMQGFSLKPLLQGNMSTTWRTSVYYHYYDYVPNRSKIYRHEGMRSERYKLIRYYPVLPDHPSNDFEFYDLQNDPMEINNLYSNPAYTNLVKRLKNEMETAKATYGVTEPPVEPLENSARPHWTLYGV